MQVTWCAECGEMYEVGGQCPDRDKHEKPPSDFERLQARLRNKQPKRVRI